MDAVARRLELLKLEGLGFSRSEIVKKLTAIGASEKTAGLKEKCIRINT